MALTGQHFNFHRLLLGQHIGSSKPPVLPRGVNSRLALGGHFYSGGDSYGGSQIVGRAHSLYWVVRSTIFAGHRAADKRHRCAG
uniref:Uncharacterized protein n=1 Tax=Pseudomonas syringae group genomosp. 3 TaxID=251701 RepID=A0A330JYK6_9PSED|nr:hypothetical protein PSCFBP3800_P200056 [Pseudomonas syringae group genomosp. 3]